MYKCFCDKCGKEIEKKGDAYKVSWKQLWWTGDANDVHLCEKCWEKACSYLYKREEDDDDDE